MYSILAAILHLGNIEFSETENKHHTKTIVRGKDIVTKGTLNNNNSQHTFSLC